MVCGQLLVSWQHIVTTTGGADEDIKSRLNKARTAFRMLHNVWRSSKYSMVTKLKLYKSCVISTLLYGAECWCMTLRRSMCSIQRTSAEFSGPDTISNDERCESEHTSRTIMKRRWTWVGHVLCREPDSHIRVAGHLLKEREKHADMEKDSRS